MKPITQLKDMQSPTPDMDQIWNEKLIRKYDLSGPRYTSYPTALAFTDTYSEDDWTMVSSGANDHSTRLSIYIHVPFCDTICYYCGCNKVVTANRKHAERYLRYLKKEISLKAAQVSCSAQVDLIHFGGGTPTYLNDEQLSELVEHLRNKFRFEESSLECAIEIHPQTVTTQRLKKLRNIGFNRLSIGVQDFDPDVQQAVNRYNSKQEVQQIIEQAKMLGFRSTSVDLIYGLPLQTEATVAQTLKDILELAPERISLFNYAHMPELFKTQRQIDATQLPEPQEKLRILQQCIQTLTEHGYQYIGMDHFAKQNDELTLAQKEQRLHRNFQGYTAHRHSVLHAFGLSAISTLEDHYVQNVKQLDQYYALLDDNRLPIEKGYILCKDDVIRRYVINELICHFKLSFESVEYVFEIDMNTYFKEELDYLKEMELDGLIELNATHLKIKPCGRLLVRAICKVFDAYTKKDLNHQKRFSRII
jgi:oxygen-independent coproporphyrinogen-3 oxidase